MNMRKITALLVIVALVVLTTPVFAESLISRIGKAVISPAVAVVELPASTIKNIKEIDGWNIPRAIGRGVINSVARVPGEITNVFKDRAYDVEFLENNELADNDLAASVVGYGGLGAAVGASGVINNAWGATPSHANVKTAAAVGTAIGAATGAAVEEAAK